MSYTIKDICAQFGVTAEPEAFGNGHINDTYICRTNPPVILQRINTTVFNKPDEVMENIFGVTEFLAEKIKNEGGDPLRETLHFTKTLDGKNYYRADDGNAFRMYTYIDDAKSYDNADSPEILCNAAESFGRFQKMLDGYPADTLHETIKDFHNTPVRVQQLKTAIKNDAAGRAASVKSEIDTALEYAKYASAITDEMSAGTVPSRVTHNDTKLNNVLFDNATNKGLCVIDLDTVMPGSALFDFGDALRFAASSAAEDETDLSKVYFDLDKFEAYTKGFLSQTRDCLTEKEIELLPLSVLILTYECGTRFLADHLNGDVYFKIHRENHNLDRARTQLTLVKDIESKLDKMSQIVNKYL